VTVRITEAELARDIHAVLVRVQHGVEVIVEHDHQPVAVIRTPQGPGRKLGDASLWLRRLKKGSATRQCPIPTSRKMCKRLSRHTESRSIHLHGLVLDSGVLIAAERAARPVSELLTTLAEEFGETELCCRPISVVELEHGLHRASTTALAQKRRIISTRFSRRFRLSRLPGR